MILGTLDDPLKLIVTYHISYWRERQVVQVQKCRSLWIDRSTSTIYSNTNLLCKVSFKKNPSTYLKVFLILVPALVLMNQANMDAWSL